MSSSPNCGSTTLGERKVLQSYTFSNLNNFSQHMCNNHDTKTVSSTCDLQYQSSIIIFFPSPVGFHVKVSQEVSQSNFSTHSSFIPAHPFAKPFEGYHIPRRYCSPGFAYKSYTVYSSEIVIYKRPSRAVNIC
jgi:hypothetical protein